MSLPLTKPFRRNETVTLPIKLTNAFDKVWKLHGKIKAEDVRSMEVEVTVDTRIDTIALPLWLINELGLKVIRKDTHEEMLWAVDLCIFDRSMTFDITEIDSNDDHTNKYPIIGRIPFSFFDIVFDPEQQQYQPNPENGGRWLIDCVSPMPID